MTPAREMGQGLLPGVVETSLPAGCMREELMGETGYGTDAQLSGERRFIRPMVPGDAWQGVKRATNQQYFRTGSSMVGSFGVGGRGAYDLSVGNTLFSLSPAAAPFHGGVLCSIPEMGEDYELGGAGFVSRAIDFPVIDREVGVEVAAEAGAVVVSVSEVRAPAPAATGDDEQLIENGAGAFAVQGDLAARAVDWYRHYVSLLRRLSSGHTPVAIVSYCGQGSTTEGVRRAGGSAHGNDLGDEPRYIGRFGEETFSKGDPTSVSELRDLRKRTRAFVTLVTPPCGAGGAAEDSVVTKVRDACVGAGGLYAIELEVSVEEEARSEVEQRLLTGALFGLRVDRPRLLETNFGFRVDQALVGPGRELRRADERYRRTMCECPAAMGLDEDHMDQQGLARAAPPVYGEYVFGQAAMQEVKRRFGLEAITFDEYLANPERSRRLMSHWLRGVGGASPDQGVELVAAFAAVASAGEYRLGETLASTSSRAQAGLSDEPRPPQYRPRYLEGEEAPVAAASEASVTTAEARELFYSWAGDFDAFSGPAAWWEAMTAVKPVERMGVGPTLAKLHGRNSLLFLPPGQLSKAMPRILAVVRAARGTRVTVHAFGAREESDLRAWGFRLVRRVRRGKPSYAVEGRDATLGRCGSFWALGDASSSQAAAVDYALAESAMDPRDRPGAKVEPSSAKTARSYAPLPWEKERWDIGLPPEIDEIMARRGVGIYPWEEVKPTEVPFYKWENSEGLLKSIAEADRALLAGAMEYVPAHRLPEILESSTISPWTIVDQGGGKWRLCHDYSVGTNRVVPTAAFSLPSVWDVQANIKPGSHFAKYDIRDGFWHVPVADDSRRRLVVRHPGTGRLLWCSRLPFGYVESPRLFCAMTEAIIERLRNQAAGLGIHFHVFVDDVLCVGDTEELTRRGMAMLEAEFAARGIQWAPHKRRGPCRCIEFLGLLLCNVEGLRGITITRKRRDRLAADIESWLALEPEEGGLRVEPRELASFLGKLVFVSQVVRGGRTYMQGMLGQLKGFVVDWQRGKVKPGAGTWQDLELTSSFWRDLRWWRDHLDARSLTPFEVTQVAAEAVLAGTDASNWGTGQVLWLDGAREEAVLAFTHAERRRPINWRELLGIVRVCEVGGERLRGKTVLIETDNMAARGAAAKLSSKAVDMQELVRRLLRLSERYGFVIRVTHTPGSKLDRPDQTSRGDAVEEPRFRLREDIFERLSERYGPFTSFIGAEREFSRRAPESSPLSGGRRMWVHPTSSTVGSALRRVQESMVGGMGRKPIALALVPSDGDPAWAKMLRHGLVVGSFAAGSPCLSSRTLSGWSDCANRRPLSLVLFPRAAGARVRQVERNFELERAALVPGSFVYALAQGGGAGSLCQVVDDTDGDLVVEYWRLDLTKAARQVARGPVFVREKIRDRTPYEANPTEFWSVDHIVGPSTFTGGGLVERRAFDFARANVEISREGGVWRPDGGWAGSASSSPGELSPGEPSYVEWAPDGDSNDLPAVAPPEMLEAVAGDLAAVFALQCAVNRGTEGRLASKAKRVIGGPTEGESGACRQLCQYGGGGIVCGGCRVPFRVGETMEARGLGLVHVAGACREACDRATADLAVRSEMAASRETVYYGLYSDALGISAVYTDLEEVAAATDDDGAGTPYSICSSFASYEEALKFVRVTTVARAAGAGATAGVIVLAPPVIKGSGVKRAHLFEKLSDQRLAMIDRCIAGQCGIEHDEGSTCCLGGCGRRLHVTTCAQMGSGYAALGNFRCVSCRLADMVVTGSFAEPSEEIERVVKRTMVLELNQGKETTAAGFADYTRLEERYAMGMGRILDGADLHLPRHNAECFKNFLTWMAIDADRARSIESVMRMAGTMMAKLGLPDVTKIGSVKAHAKDLLDGICMEHETATTATPAMLKWCIETGIDERFKGAFVSKREKVQFLCEGVGGCRIGEVCGGGESHGVLANNLAFLEDPSVTDPMVRSVVELKIEHSKTGFSRTLNLASVTGTSKIRVADVFMDYCKEAGFKMVTTVQAGVRVTRPDFWVVRVSLLGLDETGLIKLLRVLEKEKSPEVQQQLATTKSEARRRHIATGSESQQKKYINVAAGDSTNRRLSDLAGRLTALGYVAQLVDGPLLMSTTGGLRQMPKIMPYSTSSASAPTKELLTNAWLAGFVDGLSQDDDLDLPPGQKPKWSTHSLRRLADTVARRYRCETGVTEDQIDIYFGWNEKILLKAMQVHYASLSIKERMMLAKITGML